MEKNWFSLKSDLSESVKRNYQVEHFRIVAFQFKILLSRNKCFMLYFEMVFKAAKTDKLVHLALIITGFIVL